MGGLDKILMAGIVMSIIFIGMGTFIFEVSKPSGLIVKDLSTLESVNQTEALIEKITGQLFDSKVSEQDPLTLGFAVIRSALVAVLSIPEALGIFTTAITDIITLVPIFPDFITQLLPTFLTIIIIAIFVLAFLKVKP